VHVLTVYPGPVETPLEKRAREQLEDDFLSKAIPMGTPEVLAELVQGAIDKQSPHLFYPRFYGATRYARAASQWLTNRFAPRARR
jgi:short-subunit dehydrogenase